jgi:hypothetical protein
MLLESYPLIAALAAVTLWSVFLFAIGVVFGLWLGNSSLTRVRRIPKRNGFAAAKLAEPNLSRTEPAGLSGVTRGSAAGSRTPSALTVRGEATVERRPAADDAVPTAGQGSNNPQTRRSGGITKGARDPLVLGEHEEQVRMEPSPPSARAQELPPVAVVGQNAAPRANESAAFSEIVRLYNTEPKRMEEELRWETVGLANAKERYSNPHTPLRFARSAEGYYLVSSNGPPHWVIPFPGLVFNKNHYGLMGMGEVFDCQNYTTGYRYRKVILVRPAQFRANADEFELENTGQLELGAPEPDG